VTFYLSCSRMRGFTSNLLTFSPELPTLAFLGNDWLQWSSAKGRRNQHVLRLPPPEHFSPTYPPSILRIVEFHIVWCLRGLAGRRRRGMPEALVFDELLRQPHDHIGRVKHRRGGRLDQLAT